MNNRYLSKIFWVFPALLMILGAVACSARTGPPSASSPPPASSSDSPGEAVPSPANPEPTLLPETAPTAVLPPTGATDLLYADDYSDQASGWPAQETFDNYFVGYHPIETLYYHVEIQSPTAKALVPVPGKQKYGDITLETSVFANASNTAPEGDFRYGLAFRRTGENYYVFAVSPRSGKWALLKSSLEGVKPLEEGTDDSLQGLAPGDRLRVDASGSTFYLRVNDQLVGQVSDDSYAEGEVALYAETRDAAYLHAHFDSIAIREADAPQLSCTVATLGLRVRRGPSTAFDPILFLENETEIEPLGISPDGNWIQVHVPGSDLDGWVFNRPDWVTCNVALSDLPVVGP